METAETGDKYLGVARAMQGRLMQIKDVELFRNGSVHEFYRLKALFTSKQVNTSVVEKKKKVMQCSVNIILL